MASKKPAKESFETLYQRLEDTVSRLENGGLTLEESLSLYEEGMTLARRCQDLLRNAELRVSKLQEAFAERLAAAREEPDEYGPETGLPSKDIPLE